MAAISDNLIHFLARVDKESPGKQFEVFKKILENGLRTGRVQIKYGNHGMVYNQIICFTDIPLRECTQHTTVYGKFGIGFRKSYVKNVGGNPARYFLDYLPMETGTKATVESRGSLYATLGMQYSILQALSELLSKDPNPSLFDKEGKEIFTGKQLQELKSSLLLSFSYDKEMGDLGPARDETTEIDLYYKEREWRLVPSALAAKSGVFVGSADGGGHYLFDRSNVNMVVVPNEEMRGEVLNYLLTLRESADARLRAFGENPLPVMNYDDLDRW